MNFSSEIILWYKKNKRDLPWRNTTDPYLIWLSEVILQQTRVEQGTNYFLRLSNAFPTIKKLAAAPEEKIMKLWQGLGYYSRARNLHSTAKHILAQFDGKFPETYSEILKLKGVGTYTAAAVSSIAFNLPHAVVDGNVFRVLSRIFGIKTAIDSGNGKKEFQQLANELLDKKRPAIYNQAVMEFGAIWCKPANPDCINCPFNGICIAYNKKLVNKLPVKEKTLKVRDRYFNYLVVRHKSSVLIKKRQSNDIWKNLYDFPLIETDRELKEASLLKTKEWKALFTNSTYTINSVSETYKHVLSHQRIYARFWEIRTDKPVKISKGVFKIGQNKFPTYPVPRLIDKYMTK